MSTTGAAGAAPLELPDSDISISFVRSAGPGGQNVNKVATAAQLRFDVDGRLDVDGREIPLQLSTIVGSNGKVSVPDHALRR